jgi:anti-anti-sigma regulatory factor
VLNPAPLHQETQDRDTPLLRFEHTLADGTVELHLIGEMDLSTRGLLASAVAALPLQGIARVRIDLGRLDFCDGAGVDELLAVHRTPPAEPVVVAHSAPPHLVRLFALTGAIAALAPEGC